MAFLARTKQLPTTGDPVTGYVFANRRLVRGVSPQPIVPGDFPRYLYHEAPDGPGDSGWRIFTGDETQDDADDPDNFAVSKAETLLRVHPQLAQVLRVGVTGVWDWSDEQARYVEARD